MQQQQQQQAVYYPFQPQIGAGFGGPSQYGVVAVVGQQFCVPYPIELTVQKRPFSISGGDFNILFSDGNMALAVDGRAWSFRERRVLRDMVGNPLITLKKKLLSIHDTWEAFGGDGSRAESLIFTAKKSMLFQLRTSVSVYLGANSGQLHSDFKVKGSYFDRSCTIYQGNRVIAEVRRKYTVTNVLFGRDTFAVYVYPGIDYAFIAALVVILDEIHRDSEGGNG